MIQPERVSMYVPMCVWVIACVRLREHVQCVCRVDEWVYMCVCVCRASVHVGDSCVRTCIGGCACGSGDNMCARIHA